MVVTQSLRPNYAVQICLHKFLHEIDFAKGFERVWAEDVKYANDIFVLEVTQEFDFAKCSQTEHGVVEGGDLLDGDASLRRDMLSRAKCGAYLAIEHIFSLGLTYQTTP